MTQEQDSRQGGDDRRTDVIRGFLAEAAAPRERVLDDHMFAVGNRGWPSVRPSAVHRARHPAGRCGNPEVRRRPQRV